MFLLPVFEQLAPFRDLILTTILYALAFWLLGRKLKWDRLWQVLIPGFGYYKLGKSLDMEREGLFCFLMDAVTTLLSLIPDSLLGERAGLAVNLMILLLYVLLVVYRIRLMLRLLNHFRMKRVWVLLGLVSPCILMTIIALVPRFQPGDPDEMLEEWKAGTAPAEIAGGSGAFHLTDSGLSVDLRERSVKDLSKKRYLLKDIQLNIPNGSMVLLLGGSGAGKTTFLNAVIGYEKADATILLNGSDIYKDYGRMKYRIGFVPQQNLIRACDTVRRTVGDAALMRIPVTVSGEERHKKLNEVLDLLGLTAGCHGLVGKKSGGQLRRISIAMELVSDPELFVLDEPDSGLDGVIARELFTELRAIADTGKIVIVITHTPDRVIDLFDKVIVLARDSGRCGRLGFYGSPEEARAFFGKDSMEGVVQSVNSKDAGGEGLADQYIARYLERMADGKEAAVL